MDLENKKSVLAVGEKMKQSDKSFSVMFLKKWIPLSGLFLHQEETVSFTDDELVLFFVRQYFWYSQESRLNRTRELVVSAS